MIKKNNKEAGIVYKNILPSEYQRVEYIESTGTGSGQGKQYINTGFVPSPSGFKVNVIFSQSSSNYSTGAFVYGAYDSTNGYKPSLYVYASTRKLGVYSNSGGVNTNITSELDTENDVTITTSGSSVTYDINGATGTITNSYNPLDNETPITICTSYVGNTYILRCRIRRFRVYDENNVLARDMFPCYRKSDNKTGMYDLVTKTFYPNLATDEYDTGSNLDNIDKIYHGTDLVFEQGFIREQQSVPPITTTHEAIGKDLKDYHIYGNSGVGYLPNEYQQVEYIESDGTQYINTGLEGKNGYTFETKIKYTDFPNSYSYVAGFGTSSSNRIYFIRGQKSGLTDGWTFDGDSHNLPSVSIVADTEYVYKSIMESGNQKLYRNNILLDSATRSDTNSYGNVWLFATDYNHSPNGASACKMYYAKFTFNGELVRNFIPCYRKSDNVAGMYDTITKSFYSSLGSNAFTKGSNVYPSLEEPIEILGVGDKTKNMVNLPSVYTFTSYPNIISKVDQFELGVEYRLSWTKATKGSTYQPSVNLGGNVGWVNYLSATGGSRTFTYTTLPTNIYVYANGSNAAQSAGVTSTIEGLMITKASESGDYEPYGYKIPVVASAGGKSITTNLYFEKKKKKIGDVTDYIDFQNQKVIRKIKEYTIPSNYSVANVTKYTNTLLFSSMNVLTGGKYGITNKMCNVLPVLDAGSNVEHVQGVNNNATGTWLYIYLNKSSIPDYSDELTDNELIAKLRTLLTSKKAKVYYELATPTEDSITLPSVPTLKGTTSFSVGTNIQPSNMYVKYKGR